MEPFTGNPPMAVFCTKLEPVTVRVTAALSGGAIVGEMPDTDGVGLAGTLMMNASVLERPLSCLLVAGFSVLTKALPGVVSSSLGTLAVRLVTLLLASRVTVVAIVLPFH